jgi:HPt (histidine-containing phosphotransfer) domain-containing protein
MPVMNQGNLVAVLYAENNATRGAFTSERLDVLAVIASQAAISITNALLYSSLEQKVEERTRELAEKNREVAVMLNGMDQGIFTIDEDLRIQPQYSRHLAELLGTRDIAGQPCMAMLFRHARIRPDRLVAMEAALLGSFGTEAVIAQANLGHLVREFEVAAPDAAPRHFEVDWNLILDAQERVRKVLVALREVTMLRQLKETAQRKTRETDIVGQVLDSGLEVFREFCASARGLLGESRALLGGRGALSAEDTRRLFRNVHTVKGNARLFGYTHIVDVVHAVEEVYSGIRAGLQADVDHGRLLGDLDLVLAGIAEYEAVCERKLRPLARGQDARLEQATREIEALAHGGAAGADPAEALQQIRAALRRLRAVPLAELVRDTSRMFPSLAKELRKSVPVVEVQDQGTVLEHEWALVMRDVLVHAFRNALAHGIESTEEREAAGKEPQGMLRLRAERIEGGVRLHLSDDGKGLALDLIGQRTGRVGSADEEIADAIFSSGISTSPRVSHVAGRGVGMDVVRSAVRKLGGDVDIQFTGEKRDGHRPFELVVRLPPGAVRN